MVTSVLMRPAWKSSMIRSRSDSGVSPEMDAAPGSAAASRSCSSLNRHQTRVDSSGQDSISDRMNAGLFESPPLAIRASFDRSPIPPTWFVNRDPFRARMSELWASVRSTSWMWTWTGGIVPALSFQP